MRHVIAERAGRPPGCYVELLLAYTDELFRHLKQLRSPNMDVARMFAELDEESRKVLDLYVSSFLSSDHTGKYSRLMLVGNSKDQFEQSITHIESNEPQLLREWRVFTTEVSPENITENAIFNALGRLWPVM